MCRRLWAAHTVMKGALAVNGTEAWQYQPLFIFNDRGWPVMLCPFLTPPPQSRAGVWKWGWTGEICMFDCFMLLYLSCLQHRVFVKGLGTVDWKLYIQRCGQICHWNNASFLLKNGSVKSSYRIYTVPVLSLRCNRVQLSKQMLLYGLFVGKNMQL